MKSFIDIRTNLIVAQHEDFFNKTYPNCVMIETNIEGRTKSKVINRGFNGVSRDIFISIPAKYTPTLDEVLEPIKKEVKQRYSDAVLFDRTNLTPEQVIEIDNYQEALFNFISGITEISQAAGEIQYPAKPSFMV